MTRSYICTALLTSALILSSLLSAVAAEERTWGFELGLRYSLLTPGGEMGSVIDGTEKETSLSDLGLDDAAGAGGLTLGLKHKRANFYLSGQVSDFSGVGTTTHDITQGDVTIPAGAPLDTSMDIGIYSAIATYDLIHSTYDLGIGLGLMALDFGVDYSSFGTDIGIDETVYLPLLAINLDVYWKRFEFAALIGGAAVNANGNEVYYVNADLAARYAFVKNERWAGQVALGWRYITMDLQFEEDASDGFEADIDFSGPYVGLRFDV
jgi:hypothetical protein